MRIYENISKMSENRMPQRAYYIPYDTLEKALAGKKETSDYYKLLNGKWNFKYFKRDIDVPEKIDFKDMIDVPGVWQNFGYDNHWYTNVNYHFPVDPPFVPDDNPCGVYSRNFVIDEFWSFKKTYIVFEGVATCLFLYINGQYVGFSQGSRMQAEFDITKYVHLGENNVTARVLKYCCGSYMEDQDCFRMNGIFRDVYLLSRDIDHVNDVEIKADTKSLTVSAPEYEIYDGDKCLGKTVKDPILWNAEKPHLYTVVVKSGTEYIPFKVGMREVSISTEGEFLINGVSVKFHGVNHHDIHPKFGYYLPDEFMRSELLKMKDLNINTIRTSHYPPAPEFLNIVDELGFYVIEEADVETHGFSTMHASGFGVPGYGDTPDWICKQEEWEGAFLERAQRMVERDKNHPSIVIWSMGNESNYGRNFDAMIDYCHNRDNTRKTLYERAQVINDKCNIDIRSMMYTAVSDVERFVNNGDERPFMLVEYSHAMGNGPGDVADYIEKFYANKKFIGGCIWEWADHVVMKDGVQKYGGDSGEEIHDGNFCCDGLVFSDRSYKAGTLNAKYSYQYFAAELNSDKLKIQNRYNFTNLNEFKVVLALSIDGAEVGKKELILDIEPHEEKTIQMPFTVPDTSLYGAYLNMYLVNSSGEIRGMKQFELSECKVKKLRGGKKFTDFTEDAERIYITGRSFSYIFNKHYGGFESFVKNGAEQLADVSKLSVWRAPIDNERHVKRRWEYDYIDNTGAENLNRTHNKVYNCYIEDNKIIVEASLAGISRAPYLKYRTINEFFADGTVKVSLKANLKPEFGTFLPRLGFEFKSPVSNAGFTYFGRGPMENYCDMHHHTMVGIYHSFADDEYANYVMPQEHGNHSKTKWLRMDAGLEFFTDKEFEINVSSYEIEKIAKAKHTDELKKNGLTNIRIDYKNSGLGSHSCGPALQDKYKIIEKEFDFSFYMR